MVIDLSYLGARLCRLTLRFIGRLFIPDEE